MMPNFTLNLPCCCPGTSHFPKYVIPINGEYNLEIHAGVFSMMKFQILLLASLQGISWKSQALLNYIHTRYTTCNMGCAIPPQTLMIDHKPDTSLTLQEVG